MDTSGGVGLFLPSLYRGAFCSGFLGLNLPLSWPRTVILRGEKGLLPPLRTEECSTLSINLTSPRSNMTAR